MRTSLLLSAACSLFFSFTQAQDTFSICAVDTVTGEVGSAGASCIDASAIPGGVMIISDVHPGVGVIHTQSYWDANNQAYAGSLMNSGHSPQQIMDSVQAHDVTNNPAIRQYGVVDLFGGSARAAAFTGVNCFNYKNHIVGPNYAIQGNILLGQQILDSMEARFLDTPGDLACKLMAALQGANVPGADTRCLQSGNSSLSSFIHVAPMTGPDIVNIVVDQGPAGFEPIDSLQTLFDQVHSCPVGIEEKIPALRLKVFPNPAATHVWINVMNASSSGTLQLYDMTGKLLRSERLLSGRQRISRDGLEAGIYLLRLLSDKGEAATARVIFSD